MMVRFVAAYEKRDNNGTYGWYPLSFFAFAFE